MPKNQYKRLQKAQQDEIIEQRLIQFEGEHFNHALNLQLLQAQLAALPANLTEEDKAPLVDQIAQTEASMAAIESAINMLEGEQDKRKPKS